MKIPEYRQPPPHAGLLIDLSTVVADVESSDTSPEKLAVDFRRILTDLRSVSSSLTDACRIQMRKLANCLWNACNERGDSAALTRDPSTRAAEAEIRQAAPELLLLAGVSDEISFTAANLAWFFFYTGQEWLKLDRMDYATSCFEKGTSLVCATGSKDEQRVLLHLNVARARVASDAGDQSLAVELLRGSRRLASSSQEIKALAEIYSRVGEATLCMKPSDPAVQASNILIKALDLCDRVGSPSGDELKDRCLRFLALECLQSGDHEGTLSWIRLSRDSVGQAAEHPSMGLMALRAWICKNNMLEAEKEIEELIANPGAPEQMCMMAVEEFLASAGPEAACKVLVAFAARSRDGGAAAAVRVVTCLIHGGIGNTGRARLISVLASDERVVALFDGPANTTHRGAMHSLLWDCGVQHFRAQNYDTSAQCYEMALLYLSREEDSRPRRALCFRLLALCCLAQTHLDRALEFATKSNKEEQNFHSTFLKVKIHLQKKEENAAISQMNVMLSCRDFNPQYLAVTAHEAIACQSFRVAVASLTLLLDLCPLTMPMPSPFTEVALLRNVVDLLRRDQGTEDVILKFSRRAKLRMDDLGVEGFFGSGAAGGRELNWFAVTSLSMATVMVEQHKYYIGAEFFELAAEFFGAASNGQGDENGPRVYHSLIMCVTALLNAEEQNNSPLSDCDVKKGIEMLSRAGKLLPSIYPLGYDEKEVNKFEVLHTFNSYQLLGRTDNGHQHQLHIVKKFASSKACSPDHLLAFGEAASKVTPPNFLLAEFSLKASLNGALASQPPNYRVISAALRNLVCVASLRDSSGSDSDTTYDAYVHAYKIVADMGDGEYPFEEGKWLATTAWNNSNEARKHSKPSVAIKWMEMGLKLSRHLDSMKDHVAGMEQCFADYQNKSKVQPVAGMECSQQEISTTALLLQGSVQDYSRKVEYLYSLVLHALEFLSQNKLSRQDQQEKGSAEANENDPTTTANKEDDMFMGLDGVPAESRTTLDNNLDLDDLRKNIVRPAANLLVFEGDCVDSEASELDSYLLATCGSYGDFLLLDPCDAPAVFDFLQGKKSGKEDILAHRGGSAPSKIRSNVFASPRVRSGGIARRRTPGKVQADLDPTQEIELEESQENPNQSPPNILGSNVNCGSWSEHPCTAEANMSQPDDVDPGCPDFSDDSADEDPYKSLDPHEPSNLKVKPYKRVKGFDTRKKNALASIFPVAKMDGVGSPELTNSFEVHMSQQEKPHASQSVPLYEKLRMSFETGQEGCHPFGDSKDANQPHVDADSSDDEPELTHYGMSPTSFGKNEDPLIDEPVTQGSPEPANLAGLCHQHLDSLLASIAQAEQQTELDARVSTWKERIEHALEEQDRNPPFDIGLYGDQILDKLSSRADTGTASFSEIVTGKPKYEAARTFSALLQLVNARSVDLDKGQATNELVCYTATNPFHVKLIGSSRRPQMETRFAGKRVKSPQRSCGEDGETSQAQQKSSKKQRT